MSTLKTLNEPLFEINQDSEFFKRSNERREKQTRVNEILDEVAIRIGCAVKEFNYYGSQSFGFMHDSEGYLKFRNELTKNSDRNGLYTFKKSSKTFKLVSPMMEEIDDIRNIVSPFELHHVVGMNNAVATQWIAGRMFVGVKDIEVARYEITKLGRMKEYPVEPLKPIEYHEYLKLFLEATAKQEQEQGA